MSEDQLAPHWRMDTSWLRLAVKNRELVPEANVENGSAPREGGANEMFPKAKKTKLDMLALGAQMAARSAELMAQA